VNLAWMISKMEKPISGHGTSTVSILFKIRQRLDPG